MRVRGYLGPSTAILGHLGGHLGFSEALLGPSWAILDAAMGRAPPRPNPGRGGEVNLPSRERQEVGKGNALDHLRPEGWWDSVGDDDDDDHEEEEAPGGLQESHQPSGRRWSRAFPFRISFLPLFGEVYLPTPPPCVWTGGPRPIAASKMAQDGFKRAPETPRLPPRWPKIAVDGLR